MKQLRMPETEIALVGRGQHLDVFLCHPYLSLLPLWRYDTPVTGFPQSGKVMEKFVIMGSHGKVMENNKYVKSHGKVKILP